MSGKGVARTIVALVSVVFLSWAGFVGQAPAQEDRERAEGNEVIKNRVFLLGEVEVVGKEEKSKNTTIDKVYDDQMRLFDKNDLAEAVNLLPGVTLSETGARNEKMIFIRGFDIKHVPVFIDGIPIYVPYDGYPDLSRFNTFDLSEVIVSKGFTSVLYGPNTMGGAINMVSRRPIKEFEMNAGSGYASGHTYHAFGNFGTNRGKWYVQGGGSYVDTDHFNVSEYFTPTATQSTGARNNSYRTDWKVNAKIGLTPNDTDEYALSYINQQAEKGVPPYEGTDPSVTTRWWRWPSWDKESVYFNSHTAVQGNSYVKSRLYYDSFKNSLNSYDDATYTTISKKYAFRSWYDDYTYGGSVEAGTQLLARNFIKMSFHYKDDVHREHNEGNPIQHFEDRIFSIGLEDTIDITDRLYSIIGVSYDRAENVEAQELISATQTLRDFELGETDAFNPQGGLFLKITETGTLHATISQKSRFPSMKDKFSYKMGTALPNPDLKAERSTNYEIGYKHLLFNRITLEANLFYSDVTDFILQKTVPDPSNPGKTLNQNQNIGNINQYGIELGASGQLLKSLNGGFNYTRIQYENRSTLDSLTNIPKNKVFAYLHYFTPLKGLSVVGSVEYNGDRYSSSTGTRVAEEYTLLTTKAIYEVYRGLSLEAGINNLTDEDYALDEGYPLEGRAYFVNVRYKF